MVSTLWYHQLILAVDDPQQARTATIGIVAEE